LQRSEQFLTAGQAQGPEKGLGLMGDLLAARTADLDKDERNGHSR
jgi:hypothetical protein